MVSFISRLSTAIRTSSIEAKDQVFTREMEKVRWVVEDLMAQWVAKGQVFTREAEDLMAQWVAKDQVFTRQK